MRSKDLPNQYQFAAWDSSGNLVHAGVDGAARMDRQAAVKNQRKWIAWRVQGKARELIPCCTRMMIQPIGKPDETRVFDL